MGQERKEHEESIDNLLVFFGCLLYKNYTVRRGWGTPSFLFGWDPNMEPAPVYRHHFGLKKRTEPVAPSTYLTAVSFSLLLDLPVLDVGPELTLA